MNDINSISKESQSCSYLSQSGGKSSIADENAIEKGRNCHNSEIVHARSNNGFSYWHPSSSNPLSSIGLCHSSSSSIILVALLASLYLLLMIQTGTVQANPLTDALQVHRPYDHRSAMNTLKELDKYYSQLARPRFGKRTLAASSDEFISPNAGQQPKSTDNLDGMNADMFMMNDQFGSIIDNGPYRWLLINRKQPLTKLTENYLLEILADNMERKQQLQEQQQKRLLQTSQQIPSSRQS